MNNQDPFKCRHARIRPHSAVRALVSALCAQLPRSRRDDAGTGTACGPHHDLSLGPAVCPRAGKTMPSSPQSHDRLLESRRDFHQSPKKLDVPLPGRRLARQHAGVSLESDARCRGRQTLRASKHCTPRLVQFSKRVRSRSRWLSPQPRLTPTPPSRLLG